MPLLFKAPATCSCPAHRGLRRVLCAQVYATWLHGPRLGERLPFLPLMLTSCYCALVVGLVWLRMLLAL